MLAIKNNLMAFNAARHLGRNYDALSASVERLSSGLRINSAKDDAAGMAVRELMRADIAVLQQGSRNAADGISMLQTMEGAMAVIDENLIRMKELAEQAATGSYSDDQRKIMNAEFEQMAAEIDRISNNTSFNGIAMLNSETGFVGVHVGSGDTIQVDNVDMTTKGLNLSSDHHSATIGEVATRSEDFITLTDSANGAAEDFTLKLQFTDSVNGADETQISVTLPGVDHDGVSNGVQSYSLTEVVDAINTAAGYEAAAAVKNADGNYTLELVSSTDQVDGVSVLATTGTNLAVSGQMTVATNQTDLDVTADYAAATKNVKVSIKTAADAQAALGLVGNAITAKDEARAAFGYKMNRLESTSAIIGIQTENLQASESRISDVDVATEMAAMTKNQVLAQAGISMLSQANGMPQMALSLLQ